LAVVSLATVAVAQQEFIPIGGGSGRESRPRISTTEFGEPFTPPVIDPNDPSFQPANIAGNRPNPIPLFPTSQQAGTPHEAPADFTFTHQHPYKNPFRSDQFVGDRQTFLIGAARPNIPRTLGREMIYIDPRTNPNSEIAKAEAENKLKNMVFVGLAPPVEKLHRADEFSPSNVPIQNPWDAWYDRFEERNGPARGYSPLTTEKRPTIARFPYYAADREKREAESATNSPEAEDELTTSTTTSTTTTTAAPSTTTIVLSDAIGSTTTIAALEATSIADAAVIATTAATVAAANSTTTVKPTVAAAPTATTPPTTITTTPAPAAATSTTPAALAVATSSLPRNLTTTAAPTVAASLNGKAVTVRSGKRLNSTRRPTFEGKFPPSTPLSKSAPVEFRRRTNTTIAPVTIAQRQRSFNQTRAPLRTTLSNGVEKPVPTSANKRPLVLLKIANALGAAKNASVSSTTKLPIRTTTFFRRPAARTRASLRTLFNAITTAAATTTAKPEAASTTAAAAATTTPAGITSTTPATIQAGTTKALNKTSTTVLARTKAPFRVFSKRPLAVSKLPARTQIITEINKVGSALDTNNISTLRNEVNRLLTTVVQLQSTVIAQQERIALLENQLRRRRAAAKGAMVHGNKTTRFVAPDGRTVERTMLEIRKGRSARMRKIVSKDTNLRQRSNIA
ncbi:hypothetical protein PMAYCL1PPCAC_16915, partial [Pristionchus mayeri]